MKIFLSHPMSNLSENEVIEIRKKAVADLYVKFGFNNEQSLEIIDNYHHDCNETLTNVGHLGLSIVQMSSADYVYFCGDWKNARGCRVEKLIVELYDIPSNLYDDVTEESDIECCEESPMAILIAEEIKDE